MIFRSVFGSLKTKLGGLPDTYLVFDLETTGFAPESDLILQIGHCLVVDRKVADRQSFLLDWTRAAPDRGHWPSRNGQQIRPWLENRIGQLAEAFRQQNKPFHTTLERLVTEGVDPVSTLLDYRSWLEEINERHWFLVTHNGYAFDCRFLEAHFDRFGKPLSFRSDNVFDTGAILKAAQLGLALHPGESLQQFATRVHKIRAKGVRWSLSEFAVPLFGLDAKYGLDMARAHDAGTDALTTHFLFEEMRLRAEAGG